MLCFCLARGEGQDFRKDNTPKKPQGGNFPWYEGGVGAAGKLWLKEEQYQYRQMRNTVLPKHMALRKQRQRVLKFIP